MFIISFYIFSTLLSYTDFKYYLVPNTILVTMVLLLCSFGFIESKIYISSIIISLLVLLFFIFVMLIKPSWFIGGGDIKYLMVVALYLDMLSFAYFLIITGVLQTLFLLYCQKIKNSSMAPMIPVMFLSVIIVELVNGYWGFYDIK